MNNDLWVLVREESSSAEGYIETGVTFDILGVFDSLQAAFDASGLGEEGWEMYNDRSEDYYLSEMIAETKYETVFLAIYKTKLNEVKPFNAIPGQHDYSQDLLSPSTKKLIRKLS